MKKDLIERLLIFTVIVFSVGATIVSILDETMRGEFMRLAELVLMGFFSSLVPRGKDRNV